MTGHQLRAGLRNLQQEADAQQPSLPPEQHAVIVELATGSVNAEVKLQQSQLLEILRGVHRALSQDGLGRENRFISVSIQCKRRCKMLAQDDTREITVKLSVKQVRWVLGASNRTRTDLSLFEIVQAVYRGICQDEGIGDGIGSQTAPLGISPTDPEYEHYLQKAIEIDAAREAVPSYISSEELAHVYGMTDDERVAQGVDGTEALTRVSREDEKIEREAGYVVSQEALLRNGDRQ